MLVLPEIGPSSFTIVGVDPGSRKLGLARLIVDIATKKILSVEACTLTTDRLMKDAVLDGLRSEKTIRMLTLEEHISKYMKSSMPSYVASESPFAGAHPQAFGVLTEVLCVIRRAVRNYSLILDLKLYDPPSVKIAVGNKGNADKDQMKEAVIKLNLNYVGILPLELLDEHSIDAIAVAYSQYRYLTGE